MIWPWDKPVPDLPVTDVEETNASWYSDMKAKLDRSFEEAKADLECLDEQDALECAEAPDWQPILTITQAKVSAYCEYVQGDQRVVFPLSYVAAIEVQTVGARPTIEVSISRAFACTNPTIIAIRLLSGLTYKVWIHRLKADALLAAWLAAWREHR